MAIAHALPVPSGELQSIRAGLNEQYGADVWEGEGRRVLIIRVPRQEPDPVNDVEEAIEYVAPELVNDITHCLLVGQAGAAQVYVRPVQDLMADRVKMDRTIATAMRNQLPQGLSHMTFQSPEDPRRRWRLAVRLPVSRVADMAEHHLEDLSDGLGPQLGTPRFKQLAAIYLITTEDHVRLEPDLFMPEIRAKWEDEERRTQAALRIASKAEEDRLRRDADRERLIADMEKRLGQRGVSVAASERDMQGANPARATPSGSANHAGASSTGTASPGGAPPRRAEPEPMFEAESTFITPTGPWTTHAEDTDLELPGIKPVSRPELSKTQPTDPVGETPTDSIEGDVAHHVERRNDLNHRLETLRARVDQAIGVAPTKRQLSVTERQSLKPTGRVSRMRMTDALEATESSASKPSRQDLSSKAEPSRQGQSSKAEPKTTTGFKAADDEPVEAEAPDPKLDPRGALRYRLVNAGFEVLESPDIPGHVVDVAAERPRGDPQRLVVRFAERLDVQTAKELLKTARELEVDMVLCVTEHPEPEGQRLLVATKVKAMRPGDVARLAV